MRPTLFDRDKFSGYDRIEGGTRANLGVRYTGALGNGYALRAIAGQSFHLGGLNSFATDDLVKAGSDSGLETDRCCERTARPFSASARPGLREADRSSERTASLWGARISSRRISTSNSRSRGNSSAMSAS